MRLINYAFGLFTLVLMLRTPAVRGAATDRLVQRNTSSIVTHTYWDHVFDTTWSRRLDVPDPIPEPEPEPQPAYSPPSVGSAPQGPISNSGVRSNAATSFGVLVGAIAAGIIALV